MANFIVEPLPDIKLSDADEYELPIISFHLLVIVEADPESYMLPPDEISKLEDVVFGLFTRFDAEVDPEPLGNEKITRPADTDETIVIWLKYEDSEVNNFDSFADAGFARAHFILVDSEDTELFEYYLKGTFTTHPDWRVAVIGAMFEDEVIQTANVAQRIGFSTTILTRYCLSNKVFLNLDNLFEYNQWVRTAGSKEGESFRSWFENWKDEHGGNIHNGGKEGPDKD